MFWFSIKQKSHHPPGFCQGPPPSSEPVPCTYSHAQDQKVRKNKKIIKSSPVTLKNGNNTWEVFIPHVYTKVYTKSANEKYLYCGDDTAPERKLSSPSTNK